MRMRREPLAITVAATARDDARLWISPGVASNYGKLSPLHPFLALCL